MNYRFFSKHTLLETDEFQKQFLQKMSEMDLSGRKYRLKYALLRLLNNKTVPEEILRIIRSSYQESSILAYNLKINGKQPGEDLLKQMETSPHRSRVYAELLSNMPGEKVPENVLNAIASEAYEAQQYAEHLLRTDSIVRVYDINGETKTFQIPGPKPVPMKIYEGIAKENNISYDMARFILFYFRGKMQVPDVIDKKLSEDENWMDDYNQLKREAKELQDDYPEKPKKKRETKKKS